MGGGSRDAFPTLARIRDLYTRLGGVASAPPVVIISGCVGAAG